jgi:hypothetical protein
MGYSDFLDEVRARRIKSATIAEGQGGTEIAAVTIEAQFVKPASARVTDLTSLANSVRSALLTDVLTFGQSIVIEYMDANILLWVKSNVRGLVTAQTEIGIEWRDDNV